MARGTGAECNAQTAAPRGGGSSEADPVTNAFASGSGVYPCPDGCGRFFEYCDYADDPPPIPILPQGVYSNDEGGSLGFCPSCDCELQPGYHDRIQRNAPEPVPSSDEEPTVISFLDELAALKARRIESARHALVAA